MGAGAQGIRTQESGIRNQQHPKSQGSVSRSADVGVTGGTTTHHHNPTARNNTQASSALFGISSLLSSFLTRYRAFGIPSEAFPPPLLSAAFDIPWQPRSSASRHLSSSGQPALLHSPPQSSPWSDHVDHLNETETLGHHI